MLHCLKMNNKNFLFSNALKAFICIIYYWSIQVKYLIEEKKTNEVTGAITKITTIILHKVLLWSSAALICANIFKIPSDPLSLRAHSLALPSSMAFGLRTLLPSNASLAPKCSSVLNESMSLCKTEVWSGVSRSEESLPDLA